MYNTKRPTFKNLSELQAEKEAVKINMLLKFKDIEQRIASVGDLFHFDLTGKIFNLGMSLGKNIFRRIFRRKKSTHCD